MELVYKYYRKQYHKIWRLIYGCYLDHIATKLLQMSMISKNIDRFDQFAELRVANSTYNCEMVQILRVKWSPNTGNFPPYTPPPLVKNNFRS